MNTIDEIALRIFTSGTLGDTPNWNEKIKLSFELAHEFVMQSRIQKDVNAIPVPRPRENRVA